MKLVRKANQGIYSTSHIGWEISHYLQLSYSKFILKITLESSSKEAFERNSYHDMYDKGLAGTTNYFSSFYCEQLYAFQKVLVDNRQGD